ncbi:hypothetical protein GCM10010330_21280 [Streptomyces tendae]|nr:hypothetical protein GCM10010330_21280 [Streptomyces tendae]
MRFRRGTVADPDAKRRLMDDRFVRGGELLPGPAVLNAQLQLLGSQFQQSGGEDGPRTVLGLKQPRHVQDRDVVEESGVELQLGQVQK